MLNLYGNFTDKEAFRSYFEHHYKPFLDSVEYGQELNARDVQRLRFLNDDIMAILRTDENEKDD